jgi:hypothetical protein
MSALSSILIVSALLSTEAATAPAPATVIAETRHLELRAPTLEQRASTAAAGANKGVGGAVGGAAWQSAVVDGLASFVATRTEAELSLWIVENFVGRLCPGGSDDGRKRKVDATLLRAGWFPETCALLGAGSDSAALPGGAMIAALREDVEQLPYSLLRAYLERKKVAAPEVAAVVDAARAAGGTLVALIRRGTEPVEAVALWAATDALRKHCPATGLKALPCGMAMLGEVAQWHARKCEGAASCELSVAEALSDQGLLAKLQALAPRPASERPEAPAGLPKEVDAAIRRYIDFAAWLLAHPGPEYGQTANEHARRVIARVLGLVADEIARFDPDPHAKQAALALDGVRHAVIGEYADAARALAKLLDALVEHWESDGERKGWQERRVSEATRETLIELRRYVLLVADLAAAKDAEAVHAALQSAAAPVGGWRIKRRRFTASLSALAGVAGSVEWLPERANYGATISPMAAVGLDLSGPVGKRGWTFGGFVSIVDLGQLVSARLSGRAVQSGDEGAKTASEVSVLSVLSPGGYLKVGAGRSPFTFGAGVAYAPAMRTYFYRPAGAATDVIGDPFAALRVSFFVAVDVTIFPFVRARRRAR